MADFVSDLLKKLLTSAASAAASKVGGLAAEFVLDLFGLDNNADLDALKAQLSTISDQIQRTDVQLSDLTLRVRWNNATVGFDDIVATITTHNTHLQGFLKIADQKDRDNQIKAYLSADTSLENLDSSLTLIHNRVMGVPTAITATDVPLIQVYLETHWTTIWHKDPASMHETILEVFTQAAQMQRLATTLFVAYREAKGLPKLADDPRDTLETRLIAQYQKMLGVAPDFVMLNDFAAPGVELSFSEFKIAPSLVTLRNVETAEHVDRQTMKYVDCLAPDSTPFPFLSYWTLKRIGADPKMPNYKLSALFSVPPSNWLGLPGGDVLLAATENVTSVTTHRMTVGYSRADVHLIEMAKNVAGSPLVFSVELTDELNVLRLKLSDGRTFGYFDRDNSGLLFELTDTEATPTNGLVTCAKFNKNPVVGRPALSAWSKAFAATPAGEGRFKPGYRVRYRAVHVNRFGESDKSDWLLAPKVEDHQDNEGYFGNATYYFPQIALVDPAGRTEGYRIFRQFQGGIEEEVTGGSYMGDPQNGGPVIFDDFMV